MYLFDLDNQNEPTTEQPPDASICEDEIIVQENISAGTGSKLKHNAYFLNTAQFLHPHI